MSPAQWNTNDAQQQPSVSDQPTNPNLNFANIVSDTSSFAKLGQSNNNSAEAYLPNLSIGGMANASQTQPGESNMSAPQSMGALQLATANEFGSIINTMSNIANEWQSIDSGSLGASGSGGAQGLAGAAASDAQGYGGNNQAVANGNFAAGNWGLMSPSSYSQSGDSAGFSNFQQYLSQNFAAPGDSSMPVAAATAPPSSDTSAAATAALASNQLTPQDLRTLQLDTAIVFSQIINDMSNIATEFEALDASMLGSGGQGSVVPAGSDSGAGASMSTPPAGSDSGAGASMSTPPAGSDSGAGASMSTPPAGSDSGAGASMSTPPAGSDSGAGASMSTPPAGSDSGAGASMSTPPAGSDSGAGASMSTPPAGSDSGAGASMSTPPAGSDSGAGASMSTPPAGSDSGAGASMSTPPAGSDSGAGASMSTPPAGSDSGAGASMSTPPAGSDSGSSTPPGTSTPIMSAGGTATPSTSDIYLPPGAVQTFDSNFANGGLSQFTNGSDLGGNTYYPSNGELQRYSANNATVDANGILEMPVTDNGNGTYGSGMIVTNSFAQNGGVFDMNAKLPAGGDSWPAFWMLSPTGQPGEIDALEALGSGQNDSGDYTPANGWIHTAVHSPNGNNAGDNQGGWVQIKDASGNPVNLTDTYNNYEMVWDPGQSVTYYVDGQEVSQYTGSQSVPNTPMYLLANDAVGGTWGGTNNASATVGNQMDIASIQAWALPGDTTETSNIQQS
jgi:beta-glucanase (GH16 family)